MDVLGEEHDGPRGVARPSESNQLKSRLLVHELCQEELNREEGHRNVMVNGPKLQTLSGTMSWAASTLPGARAHTAETFAASNRGTHHSLRVRLNTLGAEELAYIYDVAPKLPGIPLQEEARWRLGSEHHGSDAYVRPPSERKGRLTWTGGGAYHYGPHVRHHVFSPEEMKELVAVGKGNPVLPAEFEMAVRMYIEFGHLLRGCGSLPAQDNQAVVSFMTHLFGTAGGTAGQAKALGWVLSGHGIRQCSPQYVESRENKVPDYGSRLPIDPDGYMRKLRQALFEKGYEPQHIDIRRAPTYGHLHIQVADRAYLARAGGWSHHREETPSELVRRISVDPTPSLARPEGSIVSALASQATQGSMHTAPTYAAFTQAERDGKMRGPVDCPIRRLHPDQAGTYPPVLPEGAFSWGLATRSELPEAETGQASAALFHGLWEDGSRPRWATPGRFLSLRAHPDTLDLSEQDVKPEIITFKADLEMQGGWSPHCVASSIPLTTKITNSKVKRRMEQIREESVREECKDWTQMRKQGESYPEQCTDPFFRQPLPGPIGYADEDPVQDEECFWDAYAAMCSVRKQMPLARCLYDRVGFLHSCLRDPDPVEAAWVYYTVVHGATIVNDFFHEPEAVADPPAYEGDHPEAVVINHDIDADIMRECTQLWEDMVEEAPQGALPHTEPRVVSPQFTIPQGKKVRKILHMSHPPGQSANSASYPQAVRLPTTAQYREGYDNPGEMVQYKSDVKGAYKTCFVAYDQRQYNCFWGWGRRRKVEGQVIVSDTGADARWFVYVGLSLQFGGSASPAAFQRITAHATRVCVRLGLHRSLVYVDDVLGLHLMGNVHAGPQ